MPDAEDIDVWLVRPDRVKDPALLARYRALLTHDEATRLAAFRAEKHRHEYLLTRALVRATLSRYRPVAPAAWRFAKNEFGRPTIDPPCGVWFNLSNCVSLVVCAVSRVREVGVDVEPLARAEEVREVQSTVFSDAELADLRALDRTKEADRLVSLWTLKEAYIKARGIGMSAPLRQITLRFGPMGAARLELAPSVGDDASPWWFHTFDVDGHRVALASAAGSAGAVVHVAETTPLA